MKKFNLVTLLALMFLFNNCGQGFKSVNFNASLSSEDSFGTVLVSTSASSNPLQLRVGENLVVAVVTSTSNQIKSQSWQKRNSSGTYVDISGSNAQLQIVNAQISDTGFYRAKVAVYNNKQTQTRDYFSDPVQIIVSSISTPTPTPTATPTPRPTATATPTPTPLPTATATPTPSPTPTTTPNPSGSALANLAAQMQHGEWRELVTNNFNGMVLPNAAGDGSSPFIEFSDEATWNPITKKVWIMGCARGVADGTNAYECGNTSSNDAGFVEYDENTNSWRRMPTAPPATAPHFYDNGAINPANGDYYVSQSAQISSFRFWKFSNGLWTNIPTPRATYTWTGGLEFFPERNELIYIGAEVMNSQVIRKLYKFPLSTNTWTPQTINEPIGEYSHFIKYSARHKLVFFGGSESSFGNKTLLMLNAQGQITRGADSPVPLGINGGSGRHSIDPVTGNFLVFSAKSGATGSNSVYSYNPSTNQWTKHGDHPLSHTWDGDTYSQISVFTPITQYGVIFAVKYGNGTKVYLYKH